MAVLEIIYKLFISSQRLCLRLSYGKNRQEFFQTQILILTWRCFLTSLSFLPLVPVCTMSNRIYTVTSWKTAARFYSVFSWLWLKYFSLCVCGEYQSQNQSLYISSISFPRDAWKLEYTLLGRNHNQKLHLEVRLPSWLYMYYVGTQFMGTCTLTIPSTWLRYIP